MSWNYRIVKHSGRRGRYYSLREVYYDKDGKPWGMTNDAITFVCDSDEGPEGIKKALAMALKDAERHPVLEEPKKWLGKAP